ncbi:hypothetical protein QZH41_001047 [Actinostola sp. cb2023]|nr:hypothetical protein QZH41_001047 [Actinostola sp. cb2023]
MSERYFHERVEPKSSQSLSVDDKKFLKKLEDGIHKRDGHYGMPLPLRCVDAVLPNNRSQALRRLAQLKVRLSREPKFRKDYTDFMEKTLKNCAEKVTQESHHEGRINYVAHHGVYHPQEPDKIRVVFDCSAHYEVTNEDLPVQTENMTDRFMSQQESTGTGTNLIFDTGSPANSQQPPKAQDDTGNPVTSRQSTALTDTGNPVTSRQSTALTDTGNPVTSRQSTALTDTGNPVTSRQPTAHTDTGNPVTSRQSTAHTDTGNPVTSRQSTAHTDTGNPVTSRQSTALTDTGNPSPATTAFGSSLYGQPSLASTAYGSSLYGQPSLATTAYGSSLYRQPSLATTSYCSSLYGQTSPATTAAHTDTGNPSLATITTGQPTVQAYSSIPVTPGQPTVQAYSSIPVTTGQRSVFRSDSDNVTSSRALTSHYMSTPTNNQPCAKLNTGVHFSTSQYNGQYHAPQPIFSQQHVSSETITPMSSPATLYNEIQPTQSIEPTLHRSSTDSVYTIAEALARITQLQRLPTAKPDVFTGEEADTKFFIWETAFDALIDSAPITTQQKLYLLYQHLSGKSKKVVEQLQYMVGSDPDLAYNEARKKLKQRFGRSAIIATDFENKLSNWPKIAHNDAQGLRDFSDLLQQVQIASTHMSTLKIFEYPSKIQALVEKLPSWFMTRTKWSIQVQVLQQREDCNAFPSFADFVKEVTFHADRLNIPPAQYRTHTHQDPHAQGHRKTLDRSHASQVPSDQLHTADGKVWYLPHFNVYHPKKPNQIRVVFDCSAVFENESLNQHLLQGPDLMNPLIGVLTRFRKEEVAIVCDIEQMFHSFFVNPEHKDFLRFLWFENNDLSGPIKEYRMNVHLFGATSSPGVANFCLHQTAETNRAEYEDEAADFLRRDFYVDDGLKSVPTVNQALELIEKSQAMCANDKLRLHKFASNKKEVLEALPAEDRAKDLKDLDLRHDPMPIQRSLGTYWCIESDTFGFRIELTAKPMTRRGILSTISSVYDPLGAVSPAKREKAQLKLQRLGQRKELERKLEEFQLTTEIEEAEIEIRIAEEIEGDSAEEKASESMGLPRQTDHEKVDKYLEECSHQSPQLSFAKLPDQSLQRQSTKSYTDVKVDDDQQHEQQRGCVTQSHEHEQKADDSRITNVSNTDTNVYDVLKKQQATMDEVVRNLSMPKRGYMTFEGDPVMFPLFMKNFEINVESKEEHDSDRLSYLIQFCKGKAKEAIEHCIIMPPEEGYKRAKDILRKNFGRTHIVSKAFLDKVVKGPPIRIAESEKLAQLSRDMESCMLGSSQLDMESNLNSLDTLGKVVGRLPISMKAKWAEKANQLYDKGVTPKFSHLANFVEERSAVANTYFGQLISEGKNFFYHGGELDGCV